MQEQAAVHLSLVIHHHQPVGNFEHVMQRAHEAAYRPLLDALERHPAVPAALHVSGPLLRWMERAVPEDVDRMGALVARDQLEIVGGGFYEPIFPLIPHRDRVGQVVAFADHLEKRLGRRPRGLWLPERVWETGLVFDLVEAGVEYTFVDDSLFRAAGLTDAELTGHFLTEDLGRTLSVFPISERLRYLIPFAEPAEVIDYLRSRRREDREVALLYGDDGEKFGVWPGTHRRVWEKGWMERFLDALDAAGDWLRLTPPGRLVREQRAAGKVYLPDGSYREMMEWTLTETAHDRCKALTDLLEERGEQESAVFVRGGAYRNFRARYPEANRIYAHMLRVSRKVEALGQRPEAAEIRDDLYQGQCNCAYWHGVFGGLYLPHLRAALHRHLIRAEAAADRLAGLKGVEAETEDYDQDGEPEVLLSTPYHDLVVKPTEGGHIAAWNHRDKAFNVLDVLTRRSETYHRDLANAVIAPDADDEAETIHGRPRTTELGLEKWLRYDPGVRAALVDRFIPGEPPAVDPADPAFVELGDAWSGAYDRIAANGDRAGIVRLSRSTTVRGGDGEIATFVLDKVLRVDETPRIRVEYTLRPAPPECRFAVELSLGIPTCLGPRYARLGDRGETFGLGETNRIEATGPVHFVDEDLGIHFVLAAESGCTVWTYPIYTISNSEQGFERTFQGVGVLTGFTLRPSEENTVVLEMELR